MSLLYLKFSSPFCQEKVSTFSSVYEVLHCTLMSLTVQLPSHSRYTTELLQACQLPHFGFPPCYQSMINCSLSNLFCIWLWFFFSFAFHIFWMTVNALYHWKHLKTGDLKVTDKVTPFSYTINEHHVCSPNNILINVITTYSRKNLNSYVIYSLILRSYRLKTKSTFKQLHCQR